jgi:hypothetical protein
MIWERPRAKKGLLDVEFWKASGNKGRERAAAVVGDWKGVGGIAMAVSSWVGIVVIVAIVACVAGVGVMGECSWHCGRQGTDVVGTKME